MEYKIDLHSEINNIQNFKSLLEKYKDYDSCIRDIKISTLLGEKCLLSRASSGTPPCPLLTDFYRTSQYVPDRRSHHIHVSVSLSPLLSIFQHHLDNSMDN